MQHEYIQGSGFITEIVSTSRIKSTSIKIGDDAVFVVVLRDLPEERIVQLLNSKNRWIKEKVILQRESMPVSGKQYVTGNPLPT